ncbi:MAG: AMP-binding acetyl-CoA synthetase [Limnobacter sp. CACIAM 66H1]|uniref:AMP-binding protein n=1 Tax=Limnobacter sp. CACIAM 66H1 TaxID=1813033 RepID=UPI0007A8E59D|nr:AMP-binding protein [Limnobacter sp. CACIAM 66H1]KYP12071.1 MAG: AMP-binding acetyl-CoA synthetase [Limnobacter sp. CACIAM 66H1]
MSAAQYDKFETLLDCLDHWATTQPNKVYFTQPFSTEKTVDYTWGQVADQVNRMAAYLQSLNLPEKTHIGILGKNSAHWIMADLAIWRAGHVSIPLYPTLNAETAEYVLENSDSKMIFIGKMDELWRVVEKGIPTSMPTITLPLAPQLAHAKKWDDIVAATAPTQNPVKRSKDEMATMLYTSGSTGKPKGVMISFNAMISALRGTSKVMSFSNTDRMISYLPLAHAAERAILETGSLFYGFHVYFSFGLDSFIQDLQRARPTLFFSVPRLWTKFYNGICGKIPLGVQQVIFRIPILSGLFKKFLLKKLGLSEVRMALSGSAPLAPALMSWYRNLGLDLLEGYAMSENFAYSHCSLPGKVRVGYVGNTYPGVECKISEVGEVLVKSPCNMMGYYKNPELTAQSYTEDGFLKTGDMGVIDDQGRLKITGRVKELFKTSKGKYIAPVPIENRLNGHELIEAVCVTGPSFSQPFALVMLPLEEHKQVEQNPSEAARVESEMTELLNHVNGQLEAHEKLSCIVVVKDLWTMENGFLTPTMKIKRNVIEENYLPKAEAWVKMKKPVVIEQ